MLSTLNLDSLGSPRLLVIGDLMLDEYIWGSVSRISPEAPVPVVHGRHREFRSGGAGSVVENLAVLGARVQVCGLLGADEAGDHFTEILSKHGVSQSGLIRSTMRPTTRKTRVVSSVQQAHRAQQQVCRIDWEEVSPPNAQEREEIFSYLNKCFEQAPTAVLISDYEKGLLSPEVLSFVFELAKKSGVPTLVDPGRSVNYDRYRGATLICPNRFESEQATDMRLHTESDFAACSKQLIERLQLDFVALTLDREGIYLAAKTGEQILVPTKAKAVADVAGAGDMVLSLLGLAMGAQWSVEQAVQLANIGAGIEVGKVGVTPVERWEIEQAMASGDSGPSKIRRLEELASILKRERRLGRQVVFTNGCFDILHAGHIKILEKSRSFGDLLVVGMNSDPSIRRLKGDKRPIVEAENRGAVMSALPFVDHIVIFDEDTPIALIEQLVPDVLVKGADYQNREVVGREVVEANGGRVELVDLKPEISTSAIVERIRKTEGL